MFKTLDKTCTILEIDLVALKAIGGKKNSAVNGIICLCEFD